MPVQEYLDKHMLSRKIEDAVNAAVRAKTINSRGFWQPFTALLGDAPSVDVKKNVIVVITSDKGLCGGINSTCAKISRFLYKLTSGPEKDTKYVILGEKGKVLLVRGFKNNIELTISGLQKNPLNYTQLFHFDVHEDVWTIADATIEKDESYILTEETFISSIL